VCFEEKEIIFEFFRLSHESLPKTPTNGRIKKLFYQKKMLMKSKDRAKM